MKIKSIVLFTVPLICHLNGFGQGFINLNFEAANVSAYGTSSTSVPVTNALPGWIAYLYGSQATQVGYNSDALDATWITLLGTNNAIGEGLPISGIYSVLLQGGNYPPGGVAAAISQTGLVPSLAVSLLFEAQPGVGTLQVSLGGEDLTFFALSTGSNYTLYGADISAFAGLTEALSFSAPENGGDDRGNSWNIDNIQFTSTPVPEPSALGLSALGGVFLVWRRWHKSPQT